MMKRTAIKLVYGILAFSAGIFSARGAKPEAPCSLTADFLDDPLCTSTAAPRLGWKNSGPWTGGQTAYEIVAGTDSAKVAGKSKGDLWQTGKTAGGTMPFTVYSGKTAEPRTQVWWKVRVWNRDGDVSPWSRTARFGVGVGSDTPSPLRGEYIGMSEGQGDNRSPILRKKISVDKVKGRVMAYVNSLGYHELYVNGKRVSDNVLTPSVSQLGKRSLVTAYDVTPWIGKGENDIVLWLGQGWYKGNLYPVDHSGPVAKMEIDIVDGGEATMLCATDGTWECAASGRHDTGSWYPLQFGGERADGSIEPAAMTADALGQLEWGKVSLPQIRPHAATPDVSGGNRIYKETPAVSVAELPDGRYLADMGRVLTGWIDIEFQNLRPGQEVTLEYADNMGTDGVFEVQESDVYIGAGKGKERFRNKFNHHAYRYVRIGGLTEAPSARDITGLQIHGFMPEAGSFKCSDEDLNAVHDMLKYTMQCLTFSGYMVDCPHLERTGYGGDGNSSTMALQTMYDVAPTYANWLQAWGDVMDDNGSLPHVAPAGGGGGGPYWCGFIVMAPFRTWLNYGDRRVIEKYYPFMKRWMGYVESNMSGGLLQRWPDTPNRMWYLGDWLAPIGVDAGNGESVDLVNNCFISDCLAKMAEIASELGYTDESREWSEKRDALNTAIHSRFYKPGEGIYSTGSQLDMSYPLLTGVVPEELRDVVASRFVESVAGRDKGHIGGGLVGVPVITEWMVKSGNSDLMAGMLRQKDYPGYLHMIQNGATATWEYWNGERSRVHNCYNGAALWFYQGLGGLIPTAPGYSRFRVSPKPAQGVDWAEVEKETPFGRIRLRWEHTPAGLDYTVEVPPGSEAEVDVPEGMKSKEGKAEPSLILQPGIHKLEFINN